MVDIITRLGYPVYFLTILGVWKLLGGIVLLAPHHAPRVGTKCVTTRRIGLLSGR